jgi:hypothetical protein
MPKVWKNEGEEKKGEKEGKRPRKHKENKNTISSPIRIHIEAQAKQCILDAENTKMLKFKIWT